MSKSIKYTMTILDILKKRVIFTMFMILCICGSGYAAIDATSVPKIEIVTENVDLGQVKKGEVFEYEIEVKNIGGENLIVKNVWSNCACLEVTDERWPKGVPAQDIKHVVLKPSQSIYISARVDTSKIIGQFEKLLWVVSNDPEHRDIAWKVNGEVFDLPAESSQNVVPKSAEPVQETVKTVIQ